LSKTTTVPKLQTKGLKGGSLMTMMCAWSSTRTVWHQLYSQQRLWTQHQLLVDWYMSGSKESPLAEDSANLSQQLNIIKMSQFLRDVTTAQ